MRRGRRTYNPDQPAAAADQRQGDARGASGPIPSPAPIPTRPPGARVPARPGYTPEVPRGKPTRQQRRQQERTSPAASPRVRVRRAPRWIVPLGLVALAVLPYLGALDNPFVYDDRMTVVGNPSIRDLGDPAAIVLHDLFRPVVNLSYALDHAMWGLDPRGFHLTGIALHAATVLLLFALARRLLRDRGFETDADGPLAAGIAAGWFAVHPLMTQAVGYVSGRSEQLVLLFLLVAFLAMRRFLLTGDRRALACGLTAFVAAAASKESGAMLPLLLLAWDRLLAAGDAAARRRRLIHVHLPLLAVIGIAAVARILVFLGAEGGSAMLDPWRNLLTEATVVWRYMRLLVLPIRQSILHPVESAASAVDPIGLAALAALGLLAAFLFVVRRRAPLAVLGGVWFLLVLAPSHLVPLQEAMSEHRLYAASAGLAFAASAGLAALLHRMAGRRRFSVLGASAAVLLVLATLTVRRLTVWSDPVSLWSDAAESAPETWAVQYALAEAWREAGRCDEAVPAYRRAVELDPSVPHAWLNLGICLAQSGRTEEARQAFLAARDTDPTSAKPLTNLGALALTIGRLEEARTHLEQSLDMDPANVRTLRMLARLEEASGRRQRTLDLCRHLLELVPGDPEAAACVRRNRGNE